LARHHLAPISGSIDAADATPLAAAWRELREETTLTPTSLSLLRQGKPYTFSDASVGREWTIYPFAFRLRSRKEGGKGEAGITIDWEHDGWGWHDPLSVTDDAGFGGVPRLAESLRRVWFEVDLGSHAGAVLQAGLDRLREDHQSGARQLAGVALEALRDVIRALDAHDAPEAWWVKVRLAAWHIWKNGRESMGAAVMSVLLDALRSIEETLRQHQEHPDSNHSVKWRDAVVDDLERRLALRATTAANPVTEAFTTYLRGEFASTLDAGAPVRVLTLSESSTIAHCLRHMVQKAGVRLDLRVLESRPLFEGVSLAGNLVREISSDAGQRPGTVPSPKEGRKAGAAAAPRLSVTVYTDASAGLAAEGVDVVLIGADRISASGAVSNKTGTLPAILSAKHVAPSVKTVVLGESEKVAPPGSPGEHVVEDNSPDQLVRAWKSDFNSARVRDAASSLSAAMDDAGTEAAEVAVRNIFFEWVPPALVDIYVTEFGVWTVEEIQRHSERLGAEQERLFGDL